MAIRSRQGNSRSRPATAISRAARGRAAEPCSRAPSPPLLQQSLEPSRTSAHSCRTDTTMEPITSITSHYLVFPADNVDTDQIIPARFLKVTDKEGLGALAFHDRRYAGDGSPDAAFPLNAPAAAGAEILVAGHNF